MVDVKLASDICLPPSMAIWITSYYWWGLEVNKGVHWLDWNGPFQSLCSPWILEDLSPLRHGELY
jgi:hypothetical protein